MTIRLLAARDPYPINAIVSLDVLTETNLITAKQATLDLTGGVSYVAPIVPMLHPPALLGSDASGNTTGIIDPKTGVTISFGNGNGNGNGGSGLPTISAQTSVTLTTAAPATSGNYTAFPAQACTELRIENRTGVEIEYVRNGGTNFVSIRPGVTRRIVGITNASQISVRRSDWADPSTNVTTRTSVVVATAVTSTETFAGATILNQAIAGGAISPNLPSQACTGVEIINNYGKNIQFRVGTAPYVRLNSGASAVILGITNASQVQIQPVDGIVDSTRPVMAEAFTSGLREPLNLTQPQDMIGANASLMLGDLQTANSLWPTPTLLKAGEVARGPRRTLAPKRVYPLAQFTTVAAMSGSGVANSIDATDGEIIAGTSHIEWTSPSANTYNFAAAATANSTAIDVTGGMIRFTVCFPDGTPHFKTTNALNSLRVQLHSTGSPAAPSANYHQASLIPQALIDTVSQAKRVFTFSIPTVQFAAQGTGATLTAITWARFQLSTGSAGTGAKFRPISIEYVPNALTKPIVVITFDDFHSGVWTGALPAMSKYGYPGVMFGDAIASLGNSGSTGLTPEQVRTLHQRYGWQVANQNYNGETTTYESIEQMMQEHSKFNLAMMALGVGDLDDTSAGTGSGGFNNIRDDNSPAVKRMYRSCSLFKNGSDVTPPMSAGETAPFGDPYLIKRLNMSGYGTTAANHLQRWQEHVDQAVTNKGIALFALHGELNVGATGNSVYVQTSFPTFIDYLRTRELAGDIEVLTLAQAIEKIYPRL